MCVKRRASLFTIISLFAFSNLIVLGIALGTEYWINAALIRDFSKFNLTNDDNSDPAFVPIPLRGYLGENGIDGSDPGAFRGVMKFGLFSGCKRFNYGLGVRDPSCFPVFTEHKGVYNLNINIAVIVCILCAIIFGLVATVFGLVNTLTVPIETIHGPTGLYIWNAIGGLFSGAGWVLYLVLYLTELQTNVLSEVDKSRNYETDSVNLGASYWLLIVSCGLFICNIPLAYFTSLAQDPDYMWRLKKGHDLSESTNKVDVGLGLMY